MFLKSDKRFAIVASCFLMCQFSCDVAADCFPGGCVPSGKTGGCCSGSGRTTLNCPGPAFYRCDTVPPKYKCNHVNVTCAVDPNGTYPSETSCVDGCEPTYKCYPKNGTCGIDSTGSGMSNATCRGSCTVPKPVDASWSVVASMKTARWYHGVAGVGSANSNLVMAAGGFINLFGGTISSVEIFNASSGSNGSWSAGPSMLANRGGLALTMIATDGRVVAAGGCDNDLNYLSSAEIYDPTFANWTYIASMHTPRRIFAMASLPDGRLVAAGGDDNGNARVEAEMYFPTNNTWKVITQMTRGHSYYGLVTLIAQNRLLAVSSGARIDTYNPVLNVWNQTTPLPFGVLSNTAVTLRDGRVLMWPGEEPNGSPSPNITQALVYDPVVDVWVKVTNLIPAPQARINFGAAVLADGRVLAAGGFTWPYGSETSSAMMFTLTPVTLLP